MRPVLLLLLAVLPLQPAGPALTCLGPDGTEWRTALEEDGPPPHSTPLVGRRWHPTLLDIDVPLLEGGSLSMAETRGQVLVLEFWATWCPPCWEILPVLQDLYESEHERGLAIVAVNVNESRHVALPAAREMGLTMPIGEYTDEIEQLFHVETLPTVVVADRKGRVRGRWDRHQLGVMEEVIALVEELLEDVEGRDPEPPVARVATGGELFKVEWIRRTPARPHGLVIAPGADGKGGILAALGGSLVLYSREGRVIRDWRVPGGTGVLRRGESSQEGEFTVVGFRPGGRSMILLQMPEGRLESRDAPAPVFDATPVSGAGSSGEIVAGTSESLVLVAGERVSKPLEDSRLVSSLARFESKGDAWLVALSVGTPAPSRLTWLDRSLNEIGGLKGPADAWSLIVDPVRPDRVVVAPAEVTAAAVGRFVDGGSTQAAIATRSGQLVVVDLGTGKERFRAHWSDEFIAHLAAGDLDGDGLDELVAAAGQDLILLARRDQRAR